MSLDQSSTQTEQVGAADEAGEPAPAEQTADAPGAGSSPGSTPAAKPPHPVRVLTAHFATAYELLHCEGRGYAVPRQLDDPGIPANGAPGVAIPLGAEMRRRIVEVSKRLPGAPLTRTQADTVLLHLESEAHQGPEVPLALRFYHDHTFGQVCIDLGRRDGRVVVIDSSGWSVEQGPPEGVVFRRSHATKPLPLPAYGGQLIDLAPLLALEPGSLTFRALVGWLVGLPFAASVRPGVLLVGPPGSGKSTRLRLVASVLEPSPVAALGSAFGRNFADDQVRAMHRAVPLWDNLTAVSGAVSDELCTLVTGTARETRALYSDNELNTAPIARPLGLTAVGVPAGLRPDALDRLITLEAPPLPHRTDDAELQSRFDLAHPSILGAVCTAVSVALANQHAVEAPTYLRMASHARILAALDAATADGSLVGCPPRLLEAYATADSQTKQRTVVEDTFGAALLALLEARENRWSGKASDLLIAAGMYAPMNDRVHGWPTSARRVPEVLNHLRDGLAAVGVSWSTTTVRGKTRYAFTLVEPHDETSDGGQA